MNLYDRLMASFTADESSWLYRNWELVVFLIAFIALAIVANGYELSARQFPFVFLSIGAIALLAELIVHVLPDRYSNPIRQLTSGLASDIDVDVGDEDDEDDDPTSEGTVEVESESTESMNSLLVKAIVPLVIFVVLAYLISFLLAIPIYVFSAFYLVGTRNYRNAIIVSVFLMAATYLLFGEVMNVPVTDGELVGAVF